MPELNTITVASTGANSQPVYRTFRDCTIHPKDSQPVRRTAQEQADKYIKARQQAGANPHIHKET